MYKPVFHQGKLVFWSVCKGHVTDIGGPVPAGYNPDAKEIYAEGLRIPPVKLWDKGRPREDVINFILSNVRSRRDWEGDLRAQYGAVQIGERNLLALLDKYGWATLLIVMVVSYIMFGIEEIGVEIENPFGVDENDLPLERICETITTNVRTLPAP